MPEKVISSLEDFMKKNIKEKSRKLAIAKKSLNSVSSISVDKNAEIKTEEEIADEEKLEEAKKESKGKAANYDQSDMIKKLIMESIVKYVVIIAIFVICALGLLKFLPTVMSMLNGALHNLFISSMKN